MPPGVPTGCDHGKLFGLELCVAHMRFDAAWSYYRNTNIIM